MKRVFLSVFLYLLVFSAFSQNWSQKASVPGPVKETTFSFAVGGYGYVGGGQNSGGGLSGFYKYDPVADSWSTLSDIPFGPFWTPGYFTIGNKGYVCCGSTTGMYSNATWEFNPANNSWTQKADFPGSGREAPMCFVIHGHAYVGGGHLGGTTNATDWYRYDPSNNTWTQIADAPTSVKNGIGFSLAGKGYYAGGVDDNNNSMNATYQYDSTSNSWTQKSNYPASGTAGGFAFSQDGQFAVAGCGIDLSLGDAFDDFYQYDGLADQWTSMGTLGTIDGRTYATPFIINSDLYFACGRHSGATSFENECWESAKSILSVNTLAFSSEITIKVYPNPATSETQVHLTSGVGITEIRVMDMKGDMVYELRPESSSNALDIDLKSLSRGAYTIFILDYQQNSYSRKLIIQ